jgi:F-type H+-transporting ATPase subunit delta
MKISRTRISEVLAERSLTNISMKDFSQEIAAYLLAERRTGELDSLLRDIMQYRADQGIVEVVAVSAHPITPAVTSEIERQIRQLYPQAKQIVVSPEHDETVIGGVRLEMANEQLDLSVRSKLNQFKQLMAA